MSAEAAAVRPGRVPAGPAGSSGNAARATDGAGRGAECAADGAGRAAADRGSGAAEPWVGDAGADRLRAAGLRATGPRLAVLEALRELGGHRGPDEVHEAVRRRGDVLARGSVYNALRDLTATGVVLSADVGPGLTRYELGETFHHHFVCRSCGAVLDVACAVGEKPCLLPSGAWDGTPGSPVPGIAQVDEAQVIFRGLCTGCVRSAG